MSELWWLLRNWMQNSEIKTNPVFDAIKHKLNVLWLFVCWALVCVMFFWETIAFNDITPSFDWKLYMSFVVCFVLILCVSFVFHYYYKNELPQKDCYKNATAFREAIELVLQVVEGTKDIYEEDVDLLSDKNDASSEDRIPLFQRKIKEYLLEKITFVIKTDLINKSGPQYLQQKDHVDSEKTKIKTLFNASKNLGFFKDVELGDLYSRAKNRIPVGVQLSPNLVGNE